MSYRDLYVSPSLHFAYQNTPYERASVVILGVPLDRTSTFRPGARFAPRAIREGSLYSIDYSFRADISLDEVGICDLGDLDVTPNTEETLERLRLVTREILQDGKKLIAIGGEHTIALGVAKAIEGGNAIISFDAHLDLADEYMGERLNHMTFLRRLIEGGVNRALVVGVRGVEKYELEFARKNPMIDFLTVYDLRKMEPGEVAAWIKDRMGDCAHAHVSIDMDVLDPAYAPAVCSPEPEGISTTDLLSILHEVCKGTVSTVDVSEVAPHYDSGTTALQAAKLISEVACYLSRKS